MIRTRSLLIWSQTRYHCATDSSRSVQFTFSDLISVRDGAMDQTVQLEKIENGTLLERSLPMDGALNAVPPGPNSSLSHTDTEVFNPHLFHAPPPSLHQYLLEQLKHTVGNDRSFQHNSIFHFSILTRCFMISMPFNTAFTFFSMPMVIKIEIKLKCNWADPGVIRTRSLLNWSQTRYH